jgi:hypothetical protein
MSSTVPGGPRWSEVFSDGSRATRTVLVDADGTPVDATTIGGGNGLTDDELRASPVPVAPAPTSAIAASKVFSHLLGQDGTVNDAIADCNLAGNFAAPSQRIVYRTLSGGGRITGIGFILTVSTGTIAQLGWGTAVTALTTGIAIELVSDSPTDPAEPAVQTFPASKIRAVADLTANGWTESTDRAAATSIVLFLDLSLAPIEVPAGYSIRAVAAENTAVNSVDRVNVAVRYITN